MVCIAPCSTRIDLLGYISEFRSYLRLSDYFHIAYYWVFYPLAISHLSPPLSHFHILTHNYLTSIAIPYYKPSFLTNFHLASRTHLLYTLYTHGRGSQPLLKLTFHFIPTMFRPHALHASPNFCITLCSIHEMTCSLFPVLGHTTHQISTLKPFERPPPPWLHPTSSFHRTGTKYLTPITATPTSRHQGRQTQPQVAATFHTATISSIH